MNNEKYISNFPENQSSQGTANLFMADFLLNEILEGNVSEFRSSPSEVFLGKGVLKICSKFTGEHPRRNSNYLQIFTLENRSLIGKKVYRSKNNNMEEEEFEMIMYCFLFLRRKPKINCAKKRRFWVRSIFQKRKSLR